MLVCSVSQLRRRATIVTDVAEAVFAADSPGTGNVIFAALVDDPARLGEFVDAYLGDIMLEAASADDSWSASIPSTYAADVAETATAVSVQDAAFAVLLATLNGAATNVTVSNGGLTATHNNTSSNSGVRSTSVLSSGKYFFEATIGASHGSLDDVGIILSTGSYTDVQSGQNCTTCYSSSSGMIYSNGANSGRALGAAFLPGLVIRIAIDLTARKAWFQTPGLNWNNVPGEDPTTGVSGINIAGTGSFSPFVGFAAGSTGDNFTLNFGQSAYSSPAPSGYSNWPA